jgi:enoyl-CoA hydratase
VSSTRFAELAEALCGNVPVDAVLGAFAEPAGEAPVAALRPAIDALFAGNRVEDILAALDRAAAAAGPDAEFARKMAATVRAKSPLSLKVTLRQMQLGKSCDFDQCIRTEFRIVSRVVRGHDLYEGIRAVIVDKDQVPRWQPATLEAVDERQVERHFDPVENELQVP